MTGEILLVAPLRLPFLKLSAIDIKFILLAVALFLFWWKAPTGWGAGLAALGIAILILVTLVEMWKARKAPPAAPPGARGVPAPAPPATPYDEFLERARETKKKLDDHVKHRDEFDPVDPDYERAKQIMDEAEEEAKKAEKKAGATDNERKDLEKAAEEGKKAFPK